MAELLHEIGRQLRLDWIYEEVTERAELDSAQSSAA